MICWLDYHHHNLFKDKMRISLLVVRKESELKNNKNTYVLTALNKFALITKLKVKLSFNEKDIDEIIKNLEAE